MLWLWLSGCPSSSSIRSEDLGKIDVRRIKIDTCKWRPMPCKIISGDLRGLTKSQWYFFSHMNSAYRLLLWGGVERDGKIQVSQDPIFFHTSDASHGPFSIHVLPSYICQLWYILINHDKDLSWTNQNIMACHVTVERCQCSHQSGWWGCRSQPTVHQSIGAVGRSRCGPAEVAGSVAHVDLLCAW